MQKIRDIRHPYLLSIEQFKRHGDYLIIVMELADKSLADLAEEYIKQGQRGIPREELLQYVREAGEVLDLISNQYGLQHLDIKPANLFLSGGHVKVADFGLVQPRNTQLSASTLAFSPPYAPMELFDGHVHPTADQYSLAVTFQELLTGTRPFSGLDVRTLIFQHLKGKPEMSLLPATDQPVVERAISRNINERYGSCSEFVNALMRNKSLGRPQIKLDLGKLKPMGGTATKRFGAPAEGNPTPRGAIQQPATVMVGRTMNTGTQTISADELNGAAIDGRIRETFLAYLPLAVYVVKLRGFIDAMKAEIVSINDEKTVLLLRSKGGLFSRKRGFFLQVDSCARSPNSGYRVVDVAVWASQQHLSESEFARRARMLIRYLKAFLMADDKSKNFRSADQMRADILE